MGDKEGEVKTGGGKGPSTARDPHGPGSEPASNSPPKLLDQLRQALRTRHYSRRTEETYVQWVRRFIYFHHIRHPREMGEPEINNFLTHLAVRDKVSALPRRQPTSSSLFCYPPAGSGL